MSKPASPSVSLIVSTYNWPEALNLCLLSIIQQKVLPDEVIIADDGSAIETKILIEKYQESFPVPLIHVWQEDDGFQLSRIRNKAITKASKDYIVQIDGDLILEKHFIKDHKVFSKKDSFVSGSRVIMNEELSKKLIRSNKINISLASKGLVNVFNGVRIPMLSRRMENYRQEDIYYLRGCNMAFWRNDLLKVNGYNEAFTGWGREDNEIGLRLIHSGIRKRIIKFSAIVFHIYHPEKTRAGLNINDQLMQNTAEEKLTYCEKGLNQYL
ncbi:glycosyltransferase involved in cell wall biosynthesis [Pedobacter cryoconitis]|uniref:Glycosyltransferase involved in cell wall biosynthesis n=1 Tax=Pedobacter cryoconitis TaxID=188932 RepID=A0A7W8YRQ6_9SPHI|nr:glycosyltransferase family 2 protein [Pedobacter cryoconitis]MBB5620250.1 glycosyltransferase involved in cell wall biosynthesis [Pedobacter cryoconitis]